MQYALMVYRRPDDYHALSEEERAAVSREYYAVNDDPRVVGGAQLHPIEAATTVRLTDGRTLTTDGPFADTKEVFGGWYIVEADDVDAALEIASRIPVLRLGGAVEVRPIVGAAS